MNDEEVRNAVSAHMDYDEFLRIGKRLVELREEEEAKLTALSELQKAYLAANSDQEKEYVKQAVGQIRELSKKTRAEIRSLNEQLSRSMPLEKAREFYEKVTKVKK